MMTDEYQRVAEIVEQITFRDWRWRLGQDDHRMWLQVEFDAPDAECRCATRPQLCGHHKPRIQRGRKWFLSAHMTRSEIVQTALMAALAAVEHEAREDFRYRGQAVFAPHFDVEALRLLASENRVEVRA
jgi:hypothetical protein